MKFWSLWSLIFLSIHFSSALEIVQLSKGKFMDDVIATDTDGGNDDEINQFTSITALNRIKIIAEQKDSEILEE
jgi:hypothetical protein